MFQTVCQEQKVEERMHRWSGGRGTREGWERTVVARKLGYHADREAKREARNESNVPDRGIYRILAAASELNPLLIPSTPGIPISHFSHFPTREIEFHLDFRLDLLGKTSLRFLEEGNFISSITSNIYIKCLLRSSIMFR